jgi:hypothetical protein
MNWKRLTVNGCMVVILSNLIFPSISLGLIWYVDDDAPAGGNGSSWSRAYQHVQDALTAARAGDEILIAYGIYRPDQGLHVRSQNRSESFSLISGVTMEGGYLGISSRLAERSQ